MARIVYNEPEDKKEYNKLRKNWNDTYNKKNKKYKGVTFDMEGVDFNPSQQSGRQVYYDKETESAGRRKTDKEKNNSRIIMLLILNAIAFYILFKVMKMYGVTFSDIFMMFNELF